MRGLKSIALAAAVLAVTSAAQAAISYQRISQPAAWQGTPTILTVAAPTAVTVGNGDGTDAIGQSFYVAADGKLSTIELAFSGCGGEDVAVALYDLGTGSPTSNSITSYNAANLTNLLATTTTRISPSGSVGNMLYTFTDSDAVTLTGGHEYVFQFKGNSSSTFLRSGADVYPSGMLFQNGGLFGGWTAARDLGMAVTLTAVPEPATLSVLGLSSLLTLRRRRA